MPTRWLQSYHFTEFLANHFTETVSWASLVIRWVILHASTLGGTREIPAWGTKIPASCMAQPKEKKKKSRVYQILLKRSSECRHYYSCWLLRDLKITLAQVTQSVCVTGRSSARPSICARLLPMIWFHLTNTLNTLIKLTGLQMLTCLSNNYKN